jgi:hypothetical protein
MVDDPDMTRPPAAEPPVRPGPRRARRRRLIPVIAVGVVMVLAAIGVTLYFTLRDDGGTVTTDGTATTLSAGVDSFADMGRGDPVLPAARSLVGYGLLAVDAGNRFRPADPVSRAQFASLMVAVFGLECPEPPRATFFDVMPGDPAYLEVEALAPLFLAAAGAVESDGDQAASFRPADPMTTGEARRILQALVESSAPDSAAGLEAALPAAGSAGGPLTRADAALLLVPVIEALQPAAGDSLEATDVN